MCLRLAKRVCFLVAVIMIGIIPLLTPASSAPTKHPASHSEFTPTDTASTLHSKDQDCALNKVCSGSIHCGLCCPLIMPFNGFVLQISLPSIIIAMTPSWQSFYSIPELPPPVLA